MIQRWSPRPVPDADRQRWLGHLELRFGIPVAAFDGFELWQPNSKEVAIVPRSIAAPSAPPALWQGLLLLHVQMADPKPTTAAAQIFGTLATRNVIALDDPGEARAFLSRAPIALEPSRLGRVTGPGWVLLAHQGYILGVGQLARDEPPTLLSHYPKAWAI